jgi:hypothetical protein
MLYQAIPLCTFLPKLRLNFSLLFLTESDYFWFLALTAVFLSTMVK